MALDNRRPPTLHHGNRRIKAAHGDSGAIKLYTKDESEKCIGDIVLSYVRSSAQLNSPGDHLKKSVPIYENVSASA